MGPQVPFSQQLHADKYRSSGETFREATNRVAAALRDDEAHYHAFREVLQDMRFLPGGRVQAAMGSTRETTPYNCYVSGTIEDSFVDGSGSIMSRAKEAAATMRMGGGIGYDFSTLRPRFSLIRKLQSHSSGPVSFMHIFDAVCRCVASSGHRRGAQLGALRIDHPDVEEFINAKHDDSKSLSGFNVSLAVTDEFIRCLEEGRPFPLQFGGQVYRTVDPAALWETVMRSSWDWGEPGVLFVDTINRMNNLYYCERIAATNPCGEQPLPPFGACLLGSFNLVRYLHNGGGLDMGRLLADVRVVVRAMDNVVDRARYPLYEQEQEAKNKRRMGLGVTGLANALEACGHPYGSATFLVAEEQLLASLNLAIYEASVGLAAEKGAFPLFDAEKYLAGNFVKRLPKELQADIRKHGIRNSHLTSIAPTGTISWTADNVSSGLEPVVDYAYDRMYISADGPTMVPVEDYGAKFLGVRGRVQREVTVDEHLAVLEVAARNVDSAVSKTLNVPATTPWEDFKGIYLRAWRAGVKGCTTFTPGGKREGILKFRDEEESAGACYVDADGRKECE